MSLVGIAEHHHIVELAAYLTPGADGGIGVYEGAHVDSRVVAYGERSAQAAALHHGGAAAYVYGASEGVERGAEHRCSLLDEDVGGIAYDEV